MDISLWKKIKKERRLKYEDIAKLSGIPVTTVTNIFCGYVKTPRIDTVHAIEKALGISSELNDKELAGVCITQEEKDLLLLFREIGRLGGEEACRLYLEMGKTILNTKRK